MKTKYIAVPVSERLPINGKYIIGIKMELQSSTNGKAFPENILLEEVPDHSEEMLSMLERLTNHYEDVMSEDFSPMALRSDIDLAKELINKVKP
ncbi:hypothetical protein HZR00_08525 [Elizabethkingia anophelis]|nr:hypothetical protein [Elizabethkingia anophelis]